MLNKKELLKKEIDILRETRSKVEQQIREKSKELLQEIHNFSIGDFVEYDGKQGYIGIIDEPPIFVHPVLYPLKKDGTRSGKYIHIYLYDWNKKPDEKLKVIKKAEVKTNESN